MESLSSISPYSQSLLAILLLVGSLLFSLITILNVRHSRKKEQDVFDMRSAQIFFRDMLKDVNIHVEPEHVLVDQPHDGRVKCRLLGPLSQDFGFIAEGDYWVKEHRIWVVRLIKSDGTKISTPHFWP